MIWLGLVGGGPGVRWADCWVCQEEMKEGVSSCLSVLSGDLARRCEGGVGGGVARESRLQMLPESSSSQVTVGSWIARMEERGMQGVEERSWGEFARDRVEGQQFRQEELVPRIVDVCIIVRGLRVFIDSSSSPR